MRRHGNPAAPLRAAALGAGLALLAGCGGGGGGSVTPSASAAPCTDTTNATLTLVSPPAGGSGVAASSSQGASSIVVQASSPIPATVQFGLIDTTNGTSQLGGQLTGSNPYTATGFTLAAGQTYTLYIQNTAQAGCAPAQVSGQTFST